MNLQPATLGGFYSSIDPGEPSTGRPRISVGEDDCRELKRLLRGLDVLEIGTGLGISTRAIAEVAAQIVTLDIDPWVFENVDFEEFNVIQSRTRAAVAETFGPQGFEACFIDGAHESGSVYEDILFCRRMVRIAPRLAILHDFAFPPVRQAAELAGLRCEWIGTKYGLGVGYFE